MMIIVQYVGCLDGSGQLRHFLSPVSYISVHSGKLRGSYNFNALQSLHPGCQDVLRSDDYEFCTVSGFIWPLSCARWGQLRKLLTRKIIIGGVFFKVESQDKVMSHKIKY